MDILLIALVCVFILAILVITGFYILKILEWMKSRQQYKDSRSELNSDLYKLQIKWSKRGCIGYAKAINILIEGLSLEDEVEPETQEGRLKKQLALEKQNR